MIMALKNAHANGRHKESWKIINQISGRKGCRAGQIKGESKEERIRNWYEHFKGLLGNPPVITDEEKAIEDIFTDLDIKVGPFSKEEYTVAKKALKEGKAPGEDGITPEVIKRCDLDDIILNFCNRTIMHLEKPEQWSIINIITIPKTGDLSLGKNYRGISLSSIVAKMFNRMILNRIYPEVNNRLRPNQNGFR